MPSDADLPGGWIRFRMQFYEWARALVAAFNNQILDLPDMDDGSIPVPGHVSADVVEVTFTEAGQEVPMNHALGRPARNAVPCAGGGPFVYAASGRAPSRTQTFLVSWPLRDGGGAVLAEYPVTVRFLVWGGREPAQESPT